MDPNLFAIDWGRTLEAVVVIIVLAFLVERITALIVEQRWFVRNTKVPDEGSREQERETRYAEDAAAVLDLDGDPAECWEFAKTLSSSHPLAPPPEDKADAGKVMTRRAREYLNGFRRRNRRRYRLRTWPIKEVLAFLVILLTDRVALWGELLTSAVVAGGSKASIKLFHDLLGVRSMSLEAARKAKDK